jgi:hypothetical protein
MIEDINEPLNLAENGNSTKPLLVAGLISYEGRQWLAEEYSEEIGNGAWMASPIYHTDNGLEVRPAGGNWCFKSRGAVPSILEAENQKEVYESWIKHLQKTISFLRGKFPEVELDYKNKISFWQSLADACP